MHYSWHNCLIKHINTLTAARILFIYFSWNSRWIEIYYTVTFIFWKILYRISLASFWQCYLKHLHRWLSFNPWNFRYFRHSKKINKTWVSDDYRGYYMYDLNVKYFSVYIYIYMSILIRTVLVSYRIQCGRYNNNF